MRHAEDPLSFLLAIAVFKADGLGCSGLILFLLFCQRLCSSNFELRAPRSTTKFSELTIPLSITALSHRFRLEYLRRPPAIFGDALVTKLLITTTRATCAIADVATVLLCLLTESFERDVNTIMRIFASGALPAGIPRA